MKATDLQQWLVLYDLETYLFQTVHPRFAAAGTLSEHDFFAIVIWKSNRAKTRVKRGLKEARLSVADLMAQLTSASTAAEKVNALLQVQGIGLPMASAILTVCFPTEFSVLDYRSWAVLQDMGVVGSLQGKPNTVGAYLQYCQVCRALAAQHGLALRDLDRALWAKSWEDDLLALIDNIQS